MTLELLDEGFDIGHADHAGGAINHVKKPVFPNARVLLSRPEWGDWVCAETARRGGEVVGVRLRGQGPAVADRRGRRGRPGLPIAGM
jgi:hypothetical protein